MLWAVKLQCGYCNRSSLSKLLNKMKAVWALYCCCGRASAANSYVCMQATMAQLALLYILNPQQSSAFTYWRSGTKVKVVGSSCGTGNRKYYEVNMAAM